VNEADLAQKEEPAVERSLTEEVVVATPAPDTAKSLVQKRNSGRFMDVVHPSSDMRVQQKPTVSRQGISVKPVGAEGGVDVSDALGGKPETSVDELMVPDIDNSTAALVSEPEAHTDDMHALEQAASELIGLNGIMPDTQEAQPLETPFKSDLAVEKRPLGAFSVESSDTSLLSDEARSHLVSQDDHEASDIDEQEVVVDEEMKRAMDAALAGGDGESNSSLSVSKASESSDKIRDDEVTGEVDAQLTADTDVVPEEFQGDIVAIESRDVESKNPSILGVGSIPQQYKEKAVKQSEEVVPVFDATPIKHAEKKKKGWIGLVVILLLVIIGVSAGFAIYYFDPFNLFS
jgi:hypothetical protein